MFVRLVTEPPHIEITCNLIILKYKEEGWSWALATDDFTTQSNPIISCQGSTFTLLTQKSDCGCLPKQVLMNIIEDQLIIYSQLFYRTNNILPTDYSWKREVIGWVYFFFNKKVYGEINKKFMERLIRSFSYWIGRHWELALLSKGLNWKIEGGVYKGPWPLW